MDPAELSGRLDRARCSLGGLAVGDAFGQCFFTNPDVVESLVDNRVLPAGPWPYTDDTQMALSVFSSLRKHGRIEQDDLAASFAFQYDNRRGYGPSMHGLLEWI